MGVRVVVVGAGVVGASVARVLSRYEGLEVHLIDTNPDVGWGVSKANTGIVHGGYDDDPDRFPLRAELCALGNEIWHRWVEELDIPHAWSGALVVALEGDQRGELESLLERGRRNGVPELRIVEREEALALEPNLTPDVEAALWAPTVGQIHPVRATVAIVENAVDNGVRVHLETEIRGVKVKGGEVRGLETSRGFLEADIVVNAAGLRADELADMAGVEFPRIRPRRGEYWIFDRSAGPKPRRVLFPTPTLTSKGVVVTTEVSGHLMIGPNAEDLPPDAKDDVGNTAKGLEEVWERARELWPRLPSRRLVIRTFAGLRPEPEGGDFVIGTTEVWGFVNAAGTRSPGLTAAPAIALRVRDALVELGIELREKSRWKATRRDIESTIDLSWRERASRAREDPFRGRVVCRCNLVTEREVLEAIERMRAVGVRTPSLDSVKFRTGATSGTCQGSFCRVRLVEILAREFGVPLWGVTLKGRGSEVGVGDVKVLLRGRA